MAGVSGQKGLNFGGTFDIKEIIKNQEKVIKGFNEIKKASGGLTAKDFDSKPMTAYQAAMVKAKEETLALAKAKQEQMAADKAASLVLQKALADERLAREAILTQAARNRVEAQEANKSAKEQIANQQKLNAEAAKRPAIKNRDFAPDVANQNALANSTARATSIMSAQVIERAKLTSEAAKQAIAEGNLRTVTSSYVQAAQQQVQTTNTVTQSKRQLAQALAEERLIQANTTKELKNNARENLNAKGSIDQRKAAIDRLTTSYNQLSTAERNSAAGTRMANIIKGVTEQVKGLESATRSANSASKEQEGIFSQLKTQLGSAALAYGSVAAAVGAAKAVIHTNAEISDGFTDVQRTAKLTGSEVDKLIVSLKALNTRTSLEGLLDIGFEGGRLGVAKDDLLAFITTVDQLGVVLKKEIGGGAGAIAESLGKIAIVFKLAENEGITLAEAMNKVASSQLELAHSGPVTVKYLQDFTLGMAGSATAAKLSLPVIEAYGAVLGGAGQIASSAALSLTRLISGLSTKREKYFAIAQLADSTLTLEKFTDVINNDAKGALDLFFKGLTTGNPVTTELDDRLKSVGITTGKVSNSVKILAKNQELLAEKVNIGNKSYEEGSSVSHNFELANNSLAASFDKLFNVIKNSTVASSTARFFGTLINSLVTSTTEAENLAHAFKENQKEFNNTQAILTPLLVKYDALKKQSILTKDEQEDLRRVTADIGNIMPSVITKFNSYGDALDINRSKIEGATKAQRELLALQNKSTIAGARANFEDLSVRVKEFEKASLEFSKKGGGFFTSTFDQKAAAQTAESAKIVSGQAYAAAKAIRDLGGDLTELEQQSIDYYESVKKKNPAKALQEVLGDGSIDAETDTPIARTVDVIKADIKRIESLKKPLDTASKQYKDYLKQLVAFKKELKLANGGVDNSGARQESAFDTMSKRRNAIQKDINDQIELSKRKQLSADDEEVESVSKKYDDLRFKANEYFNDLKKKTPKEQQKLGLTLSGLDIAESAQKQVIIDKQSSERFKRQLEEQASLFTQFESYKETFGKESAEKRYKNEFTTAEDYAKKLENIQTLLLSEITDPADATEAQKSQLESVKTQIDSVNKYRQQKNEEALKEFMDYATKRNLLTEKYNNDLILLEGNPERIAVRTKIYNEDLKELDDANARKLESYQELFKGIEDLSNKSALKLLENARRQLSKDIKSGAIVDPDEIAKVKKYFNDVERTIKSGTGQALIGLANGMNDLIENIGKFDKSLGETLKTITDIVGQLGNVSKGFDDFKKAQGKGDTLGMASGAIGILSAGLSIFQGIDAVFSKNKQREEQNAYNLEVQGKQNESLNKLLERQISLLDKVYGTERIKNYDSAIREARDNETKYLSQLENRFVLTGDKYLDEKIAELNNTGKLSGIALGKLEEEIRKKVAKLPKDINELQKLLDEGKLDAGTASIVENLIKANQTAIDLKNNLRQELTGSSIDKLAEDFISTLTDGTQDFGKTFEETIQKSIINGFKGEIIRKQLQAFYEQFATLSEGGLTKDEIDALRKSYLEAGEQAKKDIENIQNITGINLSGENKPGEGIKGKLQRELTETTASEFLGVTRNIYEIQVKQMNIMNLSLDFARAGVQQLELIQINTANTVLRLQDTVLRLDDVVANTKPAQTQRDLGR